MKTVLCAIERSTVLVLCVTRYAFAGKGTRNMCVLLVVLRFRDAIEAYLACREVSRGSSRRTRVGIASAKVTSVGVSIFV